MITDILDDHFSEKPNQRKKKKRKVLVYYCVSY